MNSKVQFIEVEDDVFNQRIDNFILSKYSKLPKSLIYRWIRKGEVRVNKKRVKQTTKVSSKDIVRIPPFVYESETTSIKISKDNLDYLESRILHETDDYMVINKPSGIAVHSNNGESGLVERLRQIRPRARRLDLVHRLDKDTSGCLILAKKHSSLKYFFELFKSRDIAKTYYAIVHGQWSNNIKMIDSSLLRTHTKDGQRIVRIDEKEGKKAVTKILDISYINKDCSMLKIALETGRTHQIRVHCQSKGHPIISDNKYGNSIKDSSVFVKYKISKKNQSLLLHSYSLEFKDFKTNELIKITSPVDCEPRFKSLIK